MRHCATALAATSVLLLCACTAISPPPSQMPSAAAALDRMRATYACVNGVQGTAKIDHFSPRGRIRGDVYILAVNPDRVRFDIVSPFGATLYTLTSDGTLFQMLDVGQKQLLHGPASACNLARLTQVPIPGHALVSLLRGEAPILVHEPTGASIGWDTNGFYRVLLHSTREAAEEIHLEVRPEDWSRPWNEQRLRVKDVRVAQRGIDLYHAALSHHQEIQTAEPRVDPEGIDEPIQPIGGVCRAELPRSIRMQVPNAEDDVIFQYKDAKWNPPVVSRAFAQPVPGGVVRRYVDCKD